MSFELALKEIATSFTTDDGVETKIRPLESSDDKTLLGFFKNLPEPELMFFKHRVTDSDVIKGWCENIVLDVNLPLMAFDEGKIVAVATLHQNKGGWKRHIGRISCSVLPKYRQKGIAGQLVQELVDIGRMAGLQKVEAEFAKSILPAIDAGVMPRLEAVFADPDYQDLSDADLSEALSNPDFKRWYAHNTQAHKQPGYRIVTVSLKRKGIAPGDVDERELDLLADLADQYSFGELRTTHTQNIVLADVEQSKLYELWQVLDRENLARAHIGFITDMITCPGGDFCSLANAKSIPVAEAIMRRFDDLDAVYELGELSFNISGCMNACGHHHVGNIGVLGVDKKGDEFFQITLGGHADHDAELGKVVGPSFDADDVPDVVDEILNTYLDLRDTGERFIDTYRRVGIDPFKARIYPEKA